MNIGEFLEARIAEDERQASSGWSDLRDTRWERDNYGRNFLTPSAVLAECKAKRAVIGWWTEGLIGYVRVDGELTNPLLPLAAVYKDHPDYQQEWAL